MKKGFSLLEVLISIVIFTIGLIPSIFLLNESVKNLEKIKYIYNSVQEVKTIKSHMIVQPHEYLDRYTFRKIDPFGGEQIFVTYFSKK